ncbi:hypothetical protein [Streptomyces indicus]|uniref:Secreted protein n=1 Tax=Streptomyces indicus TaxID=417292 RepID=A0A1G9IFE6_9ACTN|nr:hypothetical protein [Streptomyces indicus]SDL23988.1 hypothetical protein SAMN05421806_12337 [Streptomyces indicus]
MSAAPARRSFAVPLLLSLLLAVVGVLCAAGQSAAASGGSASVAVTEVVAVDQDGGVGCGKGERGEPGSQPSAPSRAGAAAELVPAPLPAVGSAPVPDGAFLSVTSERGSPPGDPPTPVTLSVLRV